MAWAIHGAERCWARPKTVHGHARPRSRRISLRSHRARPERHASNAASWVTRAACAWLSPSTMRQATMMGTVHALLPKRR